MSARNHVDQAPEIWATFHLGGELFGLRVDEVQEVLARQPLTPVPLAPRHVVGLLNLRGQVMPAVDLRRRLGLPDRERDAEWSLLVVRTAGRAIGVVVDQIGDVLELPEASWCSPPPTLPETHRAHVPAICPIEGRMVLALRAEKIDGAGESSS